MEDLVGFRDIDCGGVGGGILGCPEQSSASKRPRKGGHITEGGGGLNRGGGHKTEEHKRGQRNIKEGRGGGLNRGGRGDMI